MQNFRGLVIITPMKQLEKQFISGAGGFSFNPLTYTQIVRNDRYAVYERSREEKVKDYETIKIKVIKAGTQIFNKTVIEDEEHYPGTSEFGRTAWSFADKTAALKRYDTLSKT